MVPGSNTEVLFNTNGNSDAVAGMTYNKGTNTFAVLGTVSSQGNIIGGNIVTVGLITTAGNVYAANITGGNLLTGGLISAAGSLNTNTSVIAQGNIRGGNLISNGLITSTGNVTGGNLLTGGLVSATGNISGNYIRAGQDINAGGNVTAVNVNANIASIIGNVYGGNISTVGLISAVGNVSGNYFIGNGRQLTGLPTSYSNTDVASFLSAYGSNTVSTTGTVTAGNITGGNVLTGGVVSAIGNVIGNYILGNGSQLTGLPANYGNSNVTTLLAAFGSNTISTTGNITVGNILNANANAQGNIGSPGVYFNTVFAQATSAQYADLAECYLADADYTPGTVVSFGGTAEVTTSDIDADPKIAGVVSTHPAHLMNSKLSGDHVVAVALVGRVPCHVIGPVTAGAMMVSAGNGRARAEVDPAMGTVIGKAVRAFDGATGTIEIVVGRI